MRKLSSTIILFVLICCNVLPAYADTKPPDIHSKAAILMDRSTGRILYQKNMHERKYPASITKIMTAIIALEQKNLNDKVTASVHAATSIPLDGSHIGIRPGEELTLEQLLYGLLVASANEGANVIAEHVAGSTDEFLKLMNKRAKELGAKNTHFANTNGLHNDEHYTTAYDMALITKHAMTIPKFREIVNTSYYEIPPTNKYNETRYLSNTNHLINKARRSAQFNYYYPLAIGVKTGWTSNANHTLVAAAKKGNRELITVVLDAEVQGNDYYSYVDTIQLFEYGFNHFSMQTIVKQGDIIEEAEVIDAKTKEPVILLADRDVKALLPNGVAISDVTKKVNVISPIKAPVQKGAALGSVSFEYNGTTIGLINLVADKDIEREPLSILKESALSFFHSLWFKVIGAVVTLPLIFILILRIRNRRRSKNTYMFRGKNNKISFTHRRKKW